jgi:hypothetical protein
MNPNNTNLNSTVLPESTPAQFLAESGGAAINPLVQGLVHRAVTSSNPLLAKVKVPGKIFQLPSKGLMYTNGELSPAVENGEVHVYPLSAMDEIKMKNPDMLFSGKAFDDVIRQCVPDVLKPLELFGKDVDALMTFIRVVTYGADFEIETKHSCPTAKDRIYAIDLNGVIGSMVPMEPTMLDTYYSVTLENGQVVVLEPIRLKHVVEMLQTSLVNKENPSFEDIQKSLVGNLLNMIRSVDGIEDKALISEWVTQVPTTYISSIADKLTMANDWGPSFDREVKCKDCGEHFLVELPVNPVSFFTK